MEHLISLAGEELLPSQPARGKQAERRATLLTDMVARGLLAVGQILYFKKQEARTCVVEQDGEQIALRVGDAVCRTPSAASTLIYGQASNGFRDLYFKDESGFRRLDDLRARYEQLVARRANDPESV